MPGEDAIFEGAQFVAFHTRFFGCATDRPARSLCRRTCDGATTPTIDTLRRLHRAHLFAVPFENLNIHLGREIVLDEARLFNKIVRQRRGGFCYELHGLFAALLRAIGFDVTLLSARVTRPAGGFGPEYGHMLLRVDLDGSWLADVGFGDSFIEPIRLSYNEQEQEGRWYRIEAGGDQMILLRRRDGEDWTPQHAFTLLPQRLGDYVDMCRYHQTSPDSHFTQKRVCSRATPHGRISLSEGRLIVNRHGERKEMPLASEAEWREALRENFGIDLATPD